MLETCFLSIAKCHYARSESYRYKSYRTPEDKSEDNKRKITLLRRCCSHKKGSILFEHNIYVTIGIMWKIEYSCKDIEKFILSLPPGLGARYVRLSELMMEFGANLGMPHTRAMSDGLFELRIKGKEGIARVFYCTQVEERIVMLHGFVKKSQKTPQKELRIARHRLLEVKSREP